jgi:hypothetical protein
MKELAVTGQVAAFIASGGSELSGPAADGSGGLSAPGAADIDGDGAGSSRAPAPSVGPARREPLEGVRERGWGSIGRRGHRRGQDARPGPGERQRFSRAHPGSRPASPIPAELLVFLMAVRGLAPSCVAAGNYLRRARAFRDF